MKVIVFNSALSEKNFEVYGGDLYTEIKSKASVVVGRGDFDSVPDLFSEEDKILLYDPDAFGGKFEPLTNALPRFKNVKYLLSPYSFYDGLDLNLVRELGIRYRNNAGANAKSVAQHALTLAMMILGRFPQLKNLKKVPDGSILGEEIFGKSAGIVGMGNIGMELVPLLRAIGLKVVYFNRSEKNVEIEKVSFEEIFKQDLIFFTIASGPGTRKMFEALPSLIQKHNYIIDISATDDFYDKKSVLKMLENGDFLGYGLELDNPSFLVTEKDCNLVTTPHMAWATVDAERRTIRNYLERTLAILEGKEKEVDFVV